MTSTLANQPGVRPQHMITFRRNSNIRVEEWAGSLLSPSEQETHIPSWYTKYMRAAEETRDIPPPNSLAKGNRLQEPTSRYNLRRPRNRSPQRKPPTTRPRRGNKDGNKNKARNWSENKNNNSKNNNKKTPRQQLIPIDYPDTTDPVFMEPSRKRRNSNVNNSIAGSQSEYCTIGGLSTIHLSTAGDSTITRDRQTERFSGTQKLINLLSHNPPFSYKPSIPPNCPAAVKEVCRRLQGAAFLRHDKLIPASLRPLIAREFPDEDLPDYLWDSIICGSSEEMELDKEVAMRHYTLVKDLYQKMGQCNGIFARGEEVNWYTKIENALCCFSLPSRKDVVSEELEDDQTPNLDFRKLGPTMCTTSDVIPTYLPYHPTSKKRTQSARVDLLIGYSRDEQPLMDVCAARDEWPFPLTPLMKLDKTFLGAIPIEVKNATGDSTDARYQLALCSSAMLRLRQLWARDQKKEFDANKPPVVISLSIIGHVWSYYVMYLDKPRKRAVAQTTQPDYDIDSIPRVLLGPFVAGHTSGLVPTFHLFHFLQVLRDWLANEWAPEVFEELAGLSIPAPSSTQGSNSTRRA